MAFIITKGYLIYRLNFDVFDEILVFIAETGQRFSCFAPGTRRIISKNARALEFGNYLEIEAFLSPNKDKMGKLKKVSILSSIEFGLLNNRALYLTNDLLNKVTNFNLKLYGFYQEILSLILLHNNEYAISCYGFVKFLKIIKFNMHYDSCIKCSSTNKIISISLVHKGLICKECLEKSDFVFSNEELILFLELNKSNVFLEPKFEELIVYENLYKKIISLYNMYKKEITF